MKLTRTLALTAALLGAAAAVQAADVGVSISVGEPGFYGRIDLGAQPAPQVIYRQPVWVHRGPAQVAPVYLRVPSGYERDWSRYCGRYDACNRPVYFVRDDWYRDHYRGHREGWRDDRRDERREDWRDHDRRHDNRRDDRRDDRDHDHGRGH